MNTDLRTTISQAHNLTRTKPPHSMTQADYTLISHAADLILDTASALGRDLSENVDHATAEELDILDMRRQLRERFGSDVEQQPYGAFQTSQGDYAYVGNVRDLRPPPSLVGSMLDGVSSLAFTDLSGLTQFYGQDIKTLPTHLLAKVERVMRNHPSAFQTSFEPRPGNQQNSTPQNQQPQAQQPFTQHQRQPIASPTRPAATRTGSYTLPRLPPLPKLPTFAEIRDEMLPDTIVDLDAELEARVDDHIEMLEWFARSVGVMGRIKAKRADLDETF